MGRKGEGEERGRGVTLSLPAPGAARLRESRPRVLRGRSPGCPCCALPERGFAAGGGECVWEPPRLRPSGGTVKGGRQPRRHGVHGRPCETHLLRREPHRGSGAPGPPLPNRPHRTGGQHGSPRASSRTDTQACAGPCPSLAPVTHRGPGARPPFAALAGALNSPPEFVCPARAISAFLGRVHLCRGGGGGYT